MKKLLTATVILAFFLIVGVFNLSFASDREAGTLLLAQQGQEKPAEADEDFEEDDEYDDAVAQINDPLFRLNYEFFLFNDAMYVAIVRPLAIGYSTVIPEEIRLCIKNFFHNLRFPIRFVNCLLQAKGTKALEEFATFFLNSTVGLAGIQTPASYYDNLPPSPEDLGQTLAVWGLGNGFYIMVPIFGPTSLRDSTMFLEALFLDPVAWTASNRAGNLDFWQYVALRTLILFNEVTFSIGDIDALREAALDPYVAIRDAYVEHRNKLIAE